MTTDDARVYREAIAANLRGYRARRRLSQEDVTNAMREMGFTYWHRPTLGRIENCERRLLAEEVPALAKILKTLPAHLLTVD